LSDAPLAQSDESAGGGGPLAQSDESAGGGGPLAGRGALVTGVSRGAGIGYAVVRRLRELGADVFVQGFVPHDAGQPWGADPAGVAALADELGVAGHVECDFADPGAPAACVAAAAGALGHVDVLVANHAMSCDQDLEQLAAEAIDATLAVNVRATLLLVQAFAARHDDGRPGGRVILFTSGQHLEPMARELPYAASKGALHGITASLAAHLAPRGILVNALNPGPTDTGWATPELTRHELRRLPLGRWGSPADAARLVGWLATDEAAWVTGQVLTSDGGFSLSRG
jgi:3-oxoacyl-[acyl-carrier protein] reductase